MRNVSLVLTKLRKEYSNHQQNERNVKPLNEYDAVVVLVKLSESCVEGSQTLTPTKDVVART